MFDYWGKAGSPGGKYHLLVYHNLDVAAVGSCYLKNNTGLASSLARMSGIDQESLVKWIVFLLAIHDLGKFSNAFQGLREDLLHLLQGRTKQKEYLLRHDTLGFKCIFECEKIWGLFHRGKALEMDEDDLRDQLEIWTAPFMGHHGQPPLDDSNSRSLKAFFLSEDEESACEYVSAVSELFFKGESFPFINSEDFDELENGFCRLSWWLAGLATLCDWIGSDGDFFVPVSQKMPLQDYWEGYAVPRARRALDNSGVFPVKSALRKDFSSLFSEIPEPSPLQAVVDGLRIASGPQLHVLEDVTGSGKTEAAFTLLQALTGTGNAGGAYIALPTTATANAMYDRTYEFYRDLYEETENPSLVLAHSDRDLSDTFRQSIISELNKDPSCIVEDQEASVECSAWLADTRKKSLLAHVGVGTIDQALLAVLLTRHQSLRLLGLKEKVLLVDEVHANDTYVHNLLRRLLEFHAAAGGSAILLSATLPRNMRQELLDSFSAGAEYEVPEIQSNEYPLISCLDSEGLSEIPVESRKEVSRSLRFELVEDEEYIYSRILEEAENGSCVVWVRNSVSDALEAYKRMHESYSENKVHLFHARFALHDRFRIEGDILARFGKHSTEKDRSGHILIATQVVEQSLDLDFDFMVSDLAPMDALIQRAGRWRRHIRDKDGNLFEDIGVDQREASPILVYGPFPDANAGSNWVRGFLPATAAVYSDHTQLYKTARWIAEKGKVDIPGDSRDVIEAVFGEIEKWEIPEAFNSNAAKVEGERNAQAALANMSNSVKLDAGYNNSSGSWWSEARTPTRLGEDTVNIRLGCWEDGELRPWAGNIPNGWRLSEVRVRSSVLCQETSTGDDQCDAARDALKRQWPGEGHDYPLIVLFPGREIGMWIGRGQNEKGELVRINYSRPEGLDIL